MGFSAWQLGHSLTPLSTSTFTCLWIRLLSFPEANKYFWGIMMSEYYATPITVELHGYIRVIQIEDILVFHNKVFQTCVRLPCLILIIFVHHSTYNDKHNEETRHQICITHPKVVFTILVSMKNLSEYHYYIFLFLECLH